AGAVLPGARRVSPGAAGVIAQVLAGVAAVAWLSWLVRPGLVAARMLQIEEYEIGRLLSWSWRSHRGLPRDTVLAGILCLAGALADLAFHGRAGEPLSAAGWGLAALWLHLSWKGPPEKRALVFTSRMRRLLGVAG